MRQLLAGVLPELVLQLLQFGQAAQMAFFAGKLSVQVDSHKVKGELLSDDSRTHNQDVHIVVLYALVGRIAVMTDSRPYARDLVNRYGSSYTTSAYQDASVCLVVENRHSQGLGIIRIVGRLAVMSPNI